MQIDKAVCSSSAQMFVDDTITAVTDNVSEILAETQGKIIIPVTLNFYNDLQSHSTRSDPGWECTPRIATHQLNQFLARNYLLHLN